jgi:exonuclease SbcC
VTEVEKILGSQDVFFASAFCDQKAEAVSDLTTAARKRLFQEAAGLGKIRAMEEATRLRKLESEKSADKALTDAEKAEIAWKARRDAELAAARNEVAGAKRTLTDTEAGANGRVAKARASIAHYGAKVDGLCGDEGTDAVAVESAEKMLVGVRTAHDIAASQLLASQAVLAGARREWDVLITALREWRSSVDVRTVDLREIEGQIKIKAADLARSSAAAGDLAKRPPECVIDSCPFIASALKARNAMAETQAQLKALEAQRDEAQAEFNELHAEILVFAVKELPAAPKAGVQVVRMLTQISDLEGPAADSAKVCLEFVAHGDPSMAVEADAKALDTLKARLTDTERDLDRKRSAAESRNRLREEYGQAMARLESEIEMELAGLQESKDKAAAAVSLAKARIADLEAATEPTELVALVCAALDAASEAKEWALLHKLLGRDYLQQFEFELVQPRLTRLTNRVLSEAFGSAYEVEFRMVDDEGREVFEILVLDRDHGGDWKRVECLSGGQSVWILKGLRLAIVLLMRERSGRRYDTILSDEEDGALDDANKRVFANMHRALLGGAGPRVAFVISHTAEVLELCDHVLRCGPGGVRRDMAEALAA